MAEQTQTHIHPQSTITSSNIEETHAFGAAGCRAAQKIFTLYANFSSPFFLCALFAFLPQNLGQNTEPKPRSATFSYQPFAAAQFSQSQFFPKRASATGNDSQATFIFFLFTTVTLESTTD